MSDQFRKLFEPGKIGPVEVKNRIIKTANGTSFVDPGQTVGERMITFYERLAKGGFDAKWIEAKKFIPWDSGEFFASFSERGKLDIEQRSG